MGHRTFLLLTFLVLQNCEDLEMLGTLLPGQKDSVLLVFYVGIFGSVFFLLFVCALLYVFYVSHGSTKKDEILLEEGDTSMNYG